MLDRFKLDPRDVIKSCAVLRPPFWLLPHFHQRAASSAPHSRAQPSEIAAGREAIEGDYSHMISARYRAGSIISDPYLFSRLRLP